MPNAPVEVRLLKKGPNGIPYAEVLVPQSVPLEKWGNVQRTIVRDLRKLVGLKACQACLSGMDLNIRRKFDHVLQIDVNSGGILQ
jgi:hypothetical protein